MANVVEIEGAFSRNGSGASAKTYPFLAYILQRTVESWLPTGENFLHGPSAPASLKDNYKEDSFTLLRGDGLSSKHTAINDAASAAFSPHIEFTDVPKAIFTGNGVRKYRTKGKNSPMQHGNGGQEASFFEAISENSTKQQQQAILTTGRATATHTATHQTFINLSEHANYGPSLEEDACSSHCRKPGFDRSEKENAFNLTVTKSQVFTDAVDEKDLLEKVQSKKFLLKPKAAKLTTVTSARCASTENMTSVSTESRYFRSENKKGSLMALPPSQLAMAHGTLQAENQATEAASAVDETLNLLNNFPSSIAEFGQKWLDFRLGKLGLVVNKSNLIPVKQLSHSAYIKEKKRIKDDLRLYDAVFLKKFGHFPLREDKEPIRLLYTYYATLKRRINQVNIPSNNTVLNEKLNAVSRNMGNDRFDTVTNAISSASNDQETQEDEFFNGVYDNGSAHNHASLATVNPDSTERAGNHSELYENAIHPDSQASNLTRYKESLENDKLLATSKTLSENLTHSKAMKNLFTDFPAEPEEADISNVIDANDIVRNINTDNFSRENAYPPRDEYNGRLDVILSPLDSNLAELGSESSARSSPDITEALQTLLIRYNHLKESKQHYQRILFNYQREFALLNNRKVEFYLDIRPIETEYRCYSSVKKKMVKIQESINSLISLGYK